MNANPTTQPSVSTSESPITVTIPQAIRYPVFITHDTLANRLASLKEFSEDLPEDQLPVLIEFVERPH